MIVCGTDFSVLAGHAATVSALFAARLGVPVRLIHVLQELGADLTLGSPDDPFDPVREALHAEAERLRGLGATVEERLAAGTADEIIVTEAASKSARLVVVGHLGRRSGAQWVLGSVAQHTSQSSAAPVLVVRGSLPFEQWLKEGRPLRVLLGADPTESSDVAIRWLSELRRLGPCDVVVAHIASPPREHARLGLGPAVDPGDLRPEAEEVLLGELSKKVVALPGEGQLRFVVRAGPSRAENHLALLADAEQVDLVVVGSHQRSGLSRLWHGSVSRGVVQNASMSVACIPKRAVVATQPERTTPALRKVLASTDLSPAGDAAVPFAYAILRSGGTVHLVHVLPQNSPASAKAEAEGRLRGLVPLDAEPRGIATVVHAVESEETAAAICAAAERIGADAICIGSHGASVAGALVGSVTARVLDESDRPVMVIRSRSR